MKNIFASFTVGLSEKLREKGMSVDNRYREMISPEEFDRRAAGTRLSPASVAIGRAYLVSGVSIKAASKIHGTTPENVRRIVARITRAD